MTRTVEAMHNAITAIRTHDPDALAMESEEDEPEQKGILYNSEDSIDEDSAVTCSGNSFQIIWKLFLEQDKTSTVRYSSRVKKDMVCLVEVPVVNGDLIGTIKVSS